MLDPHEIYWSLNGPSPKVIFSVWFGEQKAEYLAAHPEIDGNFFDAKSKKFRAWLDAKYKRPYIEYLCGETPGRIALTDEDLRRIGPPFKLSGEDLRRFGPPFTRRYIEIWFEYHTGPDFAADDFHAVCGDIDLPWASEESKAKWEKTWKSWGCL
jgi:hypothetical protein